MEIIYAIGALLSALSAVLAWIAKIYWSKEHSAATNEIIKSKESQILLLKEEIESFKEFTPMKLREYFTSVKIQLEEYNNLLQSQLSDAKMAINEKDEEINNLTSQGEKRVEELAKLETEKMELIKKTNNLDEQLNDLKERYEGEDVITYRFPKIDKNVIERIQLASASLNKEINNKNWQEISSIYSSLLSNNYNNTINYFLNHYIDNICLYRDIKNPNKKKEDDSEENKQSDKKE